MFLHQLKSRRVSCELGNFVPARVRDLAPVAPQVQAGELRELGKRVWHLRANCVNKHYHTVV